MKIYKNDHSFDPHPVKYITTITIEDADTLKAAQRFDHPACLNFASHKRPGGGYKAVQNIPMPIKTQEEDLFRRSDLPQSMDTPHIRKHYPLKGLKGIYTNGVQVWRDEKLVPHTPYDIALITVPAVVNPTDDDAELVQNKIKRILDIAADNHHNTLILGAWGCGVFRNDPTTIAETFCKYLKNEFNGVFENVIFAIPGKNSQNYQLFEAVIESLNQNSNG